MRAVQLTWPGGPDALTVSEVPAPEPADAEVLVRFEASSINPADRKIRDGLIRPRGGSSPWTLGWDLVGRVVTGGEWAEGTRVLGMSTMAATGRGTWADLVALPASSLAAVGEQVPATTLATLPLVGLTALQAVEDLQAAEGESITVVGAGGAVGLLVTRMLRNRGLAPRAVVRDLQSVRPALSELGVEIIDALPPSSEAIVDCAGLGSCEGLVRGGRFIEVVPGTGPELLPEDATRTTVRVHESGERLAHLVDLVESGELALEEPVAFELGEAHQAFDVYTTTRGRRVALFARGDR